MSKGRFVRIRGQGHCLTFEMVLRVVLMSTCRFVSRIGPGHCLIFASVLTII